MLVSESQLRSIVRASILKEQTSTGSGLLQILVSDVKANPQKYLSSKRNKLETITWKGKKYKALGFLEKGNPVALIKKSDLKPQDTSTSGPFQLLGKDKITIINSDDKRVYNLAQYEGGSSVPVFVRDNTKDVKLDIVKVDYGDPSRADWAIEVGSYIGMIPGVGTPVDLGSAVLAIIKDPPDYLLGALCVLCSAPVLGLAAGAFKIAGKGVIRTGARAAGREVTDEAVEEAAKAFVDYLKQKDIEISESVFRTLKEQTDKTLEYLKKQMKKFAEDFDLFGVCALTESTGSGGCAKSVEIAAERLKVLRSITTEFFDGVKAYREYMGRNYDTNARSDSNDFIVRLQQPRSNLARVKAKEAFKKAINSSPENIRFFKEEVLYVHQLGALADGRGLSAGAGTKSGFKILDYLGTNRSIDEIDVYARSKEVSSNWHVTSERNSYFTLKGDLTWLDTGDVATELTSTATPEVRRLFKDKGIQKLPNTVNFDNPAQLSDNVVTSPDKFDSRVTHEGIMKNWEIESFHMGSWGSLPTHFGAIKKFNFKEAINTIKKMKEILDNPGASASSDDFENFIIGQKIRGEDFPFWDVSTITEVLSRSSREGVEVSLLEDLINMKKLLEDNPDIKITFGRDRKDIKEAMPDIEQVLNFIKEFKSLTRRLSVTYPVVPGSRPGTKGHQEVKIPSSLANHPALFTLGSYEKEKFKEIIDRTIKNFAEIDEILERI